MHYEIQNVISGITPVTKSDTILAALNFIRTSKIASSNVKESEFVYKKNEAKALVSNFSAPTNQLDLKSYLTEGSKQQV